jgi:hypothetical protein
VPNTHDNTLKARTINIVATSNNASLLANLSFEHGFSISPTLPEQNFVVPRPHEDRGSTQGWDNDFMCKILLQNSLTNKKHKHESNILIMK